MSVFGSELRRLRSQRGWSQLALSLEAEVSTRHLSFLETGRASPSRSMVRRLGSALDLPLRVQNELLVAAGFAPLHRETGLEDERMACIREGIEFLLRSHDPYPAFLLSRTWDILMSNRSHRRMLAMLRRETGRPAAEPENALRLVLAPDGLRKAIRNWPQVVRALMPRLERQVRMAVEDSELCALRDEMRSYPGVTAALEEEPADAGELALLVPLQFVAGDRLLSWYTTLASFGGATDVTTQEVVIESLLPADEATQRVARRMAEERRFEE